MLPDAHALPLLFERQPKPRKRPATPNTRKGPLPLPAHSYHSSYHSSAMPAHTLSRKKGDHVEEAAASAACMRGATWAPADALPEVGTPWIVPTGALLPSTQSMKKSRDAIPFHWAPNPQADAATR